MARARASERAAAPRPTHGTRSRARTSAKNALHDVLPNSGLPRGIAGLNSPAHVGPMGSTAPDGGRCRWWLGPLRSHKSWEQEEGRCLPELVACALLARVQRTRLRAQFEAGAKMHPHPVHVASRGAPGSPAAARHGARTGATGGGGAPGRAMPVTAAGSTRPQVACSGSAQWHGTRIPVDRMMAPAIGRGAWAWHAHTNAMLQVLAPSVVSTS